jgi:hypothetical protein
LLQDHIKKERIEKTNSSKKSANVGVAASNETILLKSETFSHFIEMILLQQLLYCYWSTNF